MPMPPRSGRAPRLFAILALLPLMTAAQADLKPAPEVNNPLWAVVRLPSHGGSATVIETRDGYSLLLGCGHCFEGDLKTRPITVDVPGYQGPARSAKIELVAVDYERDLSLIAINVGPLPHVCPVGQAGLDLIGRDLLSVGYDNMAWPATVKGATVVKHQDNWTFTKEKPWHGRSGGAMIDCDTGCLVGVVHGYFVAPGGYGIYVNHRSVLEFLKGYKSKQAPRGPPPAKPKGNS